VLCNAGNSMPRTDLHAVADLYLGSALKPEPAPKPVKLDDAALEAFTGLYRKRRLAIRSRSSAMAARFGFAGRR
jgi:hypothetical protein